MRERRKSPPLRFAGPTDDWQQSRLEELCSVFTDGDWIESKDQSDSGVRLVQTGNIGVAEYLDRPNSKKWVSDETFERLHCTEVLSGDILISRLPEPAGRACIMPDIGQKMITAVDCTIARVAPEYSAGYVVQYLSTQNYFEEVNNCLAGGTRQRISRRNLSDLLVPLPASRTEQEQIGGLLGSLDDLIALRRRKFEKLLSVKTSMMGKLFPQRGSSTPQVRFAGSDGPWEMRKLGEIFQYEQPQAYIVQSTEYDSMNDIPVLTAGKSFILGYTNEHFGIKKASKTEPVVIFDDFTTSSHYVDFPFKVKSSAMKLLTPWDPEDDIYFAYNALQNVGYVPASHERHWISMFANLSVPVPRERDEQRQIGAFFRELDQLISLHRRELDKLRQVKQAMLRNMFV